MEMNISKMVYPQDTRIETATATATATEPRLGLALGLAESNAPLHSVLWGRGP